MRIPQILKSSFLEPLNVLGMIGAAAVSVLSGSVALLFVGAFAEAAYLIFVTDSDWYRARYARKENLDVEAEREDLKRDLLPGLALEDRARYERLRAAREAMERTLEPRARMELDEVLQKLDYLLDKFLVFASKRVQYRKYLLAMQYPDQVMRMDVAAERRRKLQPSGRPGWTPTPLAEVEQILPQVQRKIDDRLAALRAEMESERDQANKEVLRKNLEIVQKRKDRIEQIGRIIVNLDRQLELAEDTFGLINDEIRARSPRQILADVSDAVTQAEVTSQILEAAAPLDAQIDRIRQNTM